MKKNSLGGIGSFLFMLFMAMPVAAQTERPAGWTDATHGNRADANYEIVLPDDRINELHIIFRPEQWAAEMADMTEIYGERGGNESAGLPGGLPTGGIFAIDIESLDFAAIAEQIGVEVELLAAAAEYWPNIPAVMERLGSVDVMQLAQAVLVGNAGAGQSGDPADGIEFSLSFGRNPIWVAAEVRFEGQTWWEVGFRFKGNSSLNSGWAEAIRALPFKLDFDEFEDDFPALDNQRFFGFKQLTFSNHWSDPSWQRDKAAADIFRAAGIVAAETAYYAVYVDEGGGAGLEYWGLYTAIELPDDTLIETQFSDDNGNMYKPSGRGATFAAGSFDEQSFDKETNRDGGYEDILALFDALHAETRLSDPAAWRAGLEEVFAVDVFLRWLATNQLIQNWDSYGVIAHNYYLYNDSETGQLTWIPWDHNLALRERMGDGGPGRPPGQPPAGRASAGAIDIEYYGVARDIGLADVDERWPLIRFLLDDELYGARYRELVAEVAAGVFNAERMTPIYEANYELLANFLREKAAEEEELAVLRAATDELLAHVRGREAAVAAFLGE